MSANLKNDIVANGLEEVGLHIPILKKEDLTVWKQLHNSFF